METIMFFVASCLLVAGAAIGGIWRSYAAGKKAGANEEKTNHADQGRENLDRIKRAADARPVGGVHDDPYNRDG